MVGVQLIAFISLLNLVSVFGSNVDGSTGLEDDLQFLFKWPGDILALENDLKETAREKIEFMEIRSNQNEKYRCRIPSISSTFGDQDDDLKTHKESNTPNKELINTSGLLDSIYTRKLCSYRIESYWIYELCHGQYIKQYHEAKSSGKRLVTNEYFLGYFDSSKQEPDYLKKSDNEMIPNVHWRNLGGQKVPMFAVKYTDGTPCDILSNIPRETTIFYTCDELGNENIVAFEEISSCVYEITVITKFICSHPAYSIPERVYESISCYAVDDSPMKPRELTEIENEQATSKNEGNKIKMTDQQGGTFIVHYKTIDDDESTDEDSSESLDPSQEKANPPQQPSQQTTQPPPNVNDDAQKEMINAFLSGIQCLQGGTGWWKYEVCLGKTVSQYHLDEKTKRKTSIILGTWNLDKHLEWLAKYPNKRPLPVKEDRISVSQMYSNGDFCELSGKHRFVEVKFKCIKNKEKASSHTLSMYLLEPHSCEYILTIESPWLCNYVGSLDSNALQVVQLHQEPYLRPADDRPNRHDVP